MKIHEILLFFIFILSLLYLIVCLYLNYARYKGKRYYNALMEYDSYSYTIFQDNKKMDYIKLYLGNYKFYSMVGEWLNRYGTSNQ